MIRRAAILAVGTELTSGQTVNSNAAVISSRLDDIGIEVVEHRTVADDRKRIHQCLLELTSQCDLLVVTGGLGPTADDFTREEVARASGHELSWNETIWKQVQGRLNAAGVRVAESNRQQCFFPKSADILQNPAGTAAGFRIQVGSCQWVVLPGPPREVDAIWNASLAGWIESLAPGRHLELLTWQCLGKSEAELGEITEHALQGSGLLTGYRAHRPYIEIKVWVPLPRSPEHSAALSVLERQLSPWIVQKPGEIAPIEQLFEALAKHGTKVILHEVGLDGLLVDRWRGVARRYPGTLVSAVSQLKETPLSFYGIGEAERGLGSSWIYVEARLEDLAAPALVRVRKYEAGAMVFDRSSELKSPLVWPEHGDAALKAGIRDRILRWATESITLSVKDCLMRLGITA